MKIQCYEYGIERRAGMAVVNVLKDGALVSSVNPTVCHLAWETQKVLELALA